MQIFGIDFVIGVEILFREQIVGFMGDDGGSSVTVLRA
jgi:hypothetical protein